MDLYILGVNMAKKSCKKGRGEGKEKRKKNC